MMTREQYERQRDRAWLALERDPSPWAARLRAARAARLQAGEPEPDYGRMFEPGYTARLLARIGGEPVILDTGSEDSEGPGEVPTPRRKRRPTVASVIRQMQRAGVAVARVEVDPDTGRISVISGTPGEATDGETLIARAQWN